jgi:hypothetical protein
MTAKKRNPKRLSAKSVLGTVHKKNDWNVVWGKLRPSVGRPAQVQPVFKVVAEKIPFEFLVHVRKTLEKQKIERFGVYMAHDSMGVARYGGRGNIFTRLAAHKKKYPKELLYFSFYIIEHKAHEREIETAILRASGGQMVLNTKKVRMGIEAGNVSDYEPGTLFFERQKKRGKQVKTASA